LGSLQTRWETSETSVNVSGKPSTAFRETPEPVREVSGKPSTAFRPQTWNVQKTQNLDSPENPKSGQSTKPKIWTVHKTQNLDSPQNPKSGQSTKPKTWTVQKTQNLDTQSLKTTDGCVVVADRSRVRATNKKGWANAERADTTQNNKFSLTLPHLTNKITSGGKGFKSQSFRISPAATQ
jgi:hypothetical protein